MLWLVQLWRGIAEHLGKSSPEALVLVHPIAMGPETTTARAVQVCPRACAERFLRG